MQVLHRPGPVDDDREETVLATSVETADTSLARAVGLMLRRLSPGEALVFPLARPRPRAVHTFLVPAPIDVVWTVGDEVTRVETMRAWFDAARATADRLIELPAGTAADVAPGDTVVVEDTDRTPRRPAADEAVD